MASTKIQLNPLCKYIFKKLILNYIKLGMDSSFNVYKVKKEYSTFCQNIELLELYPLCQKYNSCFILISCYLKIKILKPIFEIMLKIMRKYLGIKCMNFLFNVKKKILG